MNAKVYTRPGQRHTVNVKYINIVGQIRTILLAYVRNNNQITIKIEFQHYFLVNNIPV